MMPRTRATPTPSTLMSTQTQYNAVLFAFTLLTLSMGGSVAEWLECWTQAQKGLGSNRSRDAVG